MKDWRVKMTKDSQLNEERDNQHNDFINSIMIKPNEFLEINIKNLEI